MYLKAEDVHYMDKVASEEYGIPEIVLMENAGVACLKHIKGNKITLVCGVGNNGGDGLVIARHLFEEEKDVKVYIFGDYNRGSKCFKTNYESLKKLGLDPISIDETCENLEKDVKERKGTVVDCLCGIGLKGKINSKGEKIINYINIYADKIIAIDIPSGMECNTGLTYDCCIKADKTITFEEKKIAFKNRESIQFTGEVIVEKIGIPREVIGNIQKNK